MIQKTALVVGSTGLVGSELLTMLLESSEYTSVISIVRKPQLVSHPKLKERVVDFENIAHYKDELKTDDVFCCLGTTIKKAGSQEAFKKVDVDYPLEIAKISKEIGVKQFLIITAMGANPTSTVFYNRMKGLVEQELIGLKLQSLHIFRPSLLLGNRKEFRLGERVASIISAGLSFLFVGSLKQYKPIYAKTVAQGMFNAAQKNINGVSVYNSKEINEL